MMESRLDTLVFNLTDENKKENNSKMFKTILNIFLVLLSFIFILVSYVAIKPLNDTYNQVNGSVSKGYFAILFVILLVVFVIFYILKKLNTSNILYFLLALGLLIKVMYMLYTPMNVRQYDTFSTNHNGHFDYTLYIYEHENKLPNHTFTEDNIYQFYHPPLNYFIQANFMRLMKILAPIDYIVKSNENLFQVNQILSCFYMFLFSVYAIKTIKLFKFKNSTILFTSIFVILFPRLVQFSGQLNNDPLATLLVILSLYRISVWYFKGKRNKDILLSSLYLGLAMSSKLSAVTTILGYAVIFLIEFIKSIRKKGDYLKLSKLCLQYVSFLIILLPLGFWFQIYSHKVYGIPYNFVFRSLNSALFTGYRGYIETRSDIYSLSYYDKNNSGLIYTNHFYNIFMRYISPIYVNDYLVDQIFCNPFENYNILTYAIRSSIMGEFQYYYGEGFALCSTILGYIIYFSLLISIIYLAIKRKINSNKCFILNFSCFISVIILYLYLQISMPFGCSMDFRYIVPIIVPIAILLGYSYDSLDDIKSSFSTSLKYIMKFSSILFAISSSLFYLCAI